jgi:hypothetical protein
MRLQLPASSFLLVLGFQLLCRLRMRGTDDGLYSLPDLLRQLR